MPLNNVEEIDYSFDLKKANKDFVGRKWLFQELEGLFNGSITTTPPGVLILGDPGSGKSAVMSRLISSPSSTSFIHENIVGYHFCNFDDEETRNGTRFVQNLVNQLAGNIPAYYHIIAEESKQKKLLHCNDFPVSCFKQTILDPLSKLSQSNTPKFILIDALNECLGIGGQSSVILKILRKSIRDFPPWIKLVLSSRNNKSIIGKLPKTFKEIVISSTDKRNLEDIRSYAERVSQDDQSKTASMKVIIDHLNVQLLEKGDGNFLHFKSLLEYLNRAEYRDQINLQSLPPSLHDLYAMSFGDRFEKDNLVGLTPLLEVLLASDTPPNRTRLNAILKLPHDQVEIRERIKKVSEYLIFKVSGNEETIRFYHQSFADWLMNQTKGDVDGLYIKISRGHERIAAYFFDYFDRRNTTLTLEELSELAMHVLYGDMIKEQVNKLNDLNVSEIRDLQTDKCILHDLAQKRESTKMLKIFLKKFDSVDILDDKGWTPAFYATYEENFENLKLLIEKGTNVNHVSKHRLYELLSRFVVEFGESVPLNFRMSLIAAQKGLTEIAQLLINNGANFSDTSDYGIKPVHKAAENGHLEVVKLLHNKSVEVDVIALHHAAAKNHSDIVRFILNNTRTRDKCLQCKPGIISSCYFITSIQYHHCLCETALHVAVSKGHFSIVKILLSFGKSTLECKHKSGKTPLLDAIERNDTEMVTLLLNEGANVEAKCENEIVNGVNIYRILSDKYIDVHLRTGNRNPSYAHRPNEVSCSCESGGIHLSARHGLWEMAKELISRWNANPFSTNCLGMTAMNVAERLGRADFVYNFNATYGNITTDVLSNKTVIAFIAVCGSVSTLKLELSRNTYTNVTRQMREYSVVALHLTPQWTLPPNDIHAHFSQIIQFCHPGVHFEQLLIIGTSGISVRSNIGNFFEPSSSDRSFPLQRLIKNYPTGLGVLSTIQNNGSAGFYWCKADFIELSPLHIAAPPGMKKKTFTKIIDKDLVFPISCSYHATNIELYPTT